jgi:hypothetical protein
MLLRELRSDEIKAGDENVAKFINILHHDTSQRYLKQHKQWYINERFHRGEHWIAYNRTANKVQVISSHKEEIRRTFNKVKIQVRGLKNFVKRNQPRWEVHPLGDDDEALADAQKKNKILQYIYRTRKIKPLLTTVVVNGFKFSMGIIEGGVVKKDGKNQLIFWEDDPFDILFDPFSPNIQSCRFIIKAFKKPIEEILDNPNYKVKRSELVSDNKEGSTQYKELLEMEKYNVGGSSSGKDSDSVIVKELWIKWLDKDNRAKFKILTCAGNQLIRTFKPSYRRYPFFGYNPERDSNSIYSNAWIKELISANKSYDKTNSQIETHIQRMVAGKWMKKKGVDTTSITDKGAEIITYDGSVPPKHLDIQSLPNTPAAYAATLDKFMQEAGGIREATLGGAPGSLQSGKALEALKSADAETVAEPIEALEELVKNMAEFSLETIADYQLASEEIIEQGESIKYIGNVEGEKPKGVTQVKGTEEVEVKIVPEIAYTEEGRKEILLRLAEAEIIDTETLLNYLSVSNIGDIIQRMQKAKEEKFKQEMMKQRESHRTEGETPTDSASLADQENMSMAAGQDVPPTPQALWIPEHLELHMAFIQENQDAYGQNKELFDAHISNEEQYQQ